MKKYFTLLTLQNGKYYAQFGDYSSAVVKEEQQDSYSDYKCKIIKTDDTQKAIDYRIAQLNADLEDQYNRINEAALIEAALIEREESND